IKTVQFTPNGQWLLAGWRSGGMRMWDVGNRGHVLTGNRVPGGFSQDGQHFAGGDGGGAAFCRLLVPRALRQFRPHHSGAVRLFWSRDNRHLVSLDHHFEVRVWDVEEGKVLDRFSARPGDHYSAPNAAVAISDDGKLAGYASGGPESLVRLRDVKNHTFLRTGTLPEGFERMVYKEGKFLLIRQEFELAQRTRYEKTGNLLGLSLVPPTSWPGAACIIRLLTASGCRNTVIREFGPGTEDAPARRSILRLAVPGEEGFHDSGVTTDGRYYWWVGPRRPAANSRVEVWEVATGQRIWKRDFP